MSITFKPYGGEVFYHVDDFPYRLLTPGKLVCGNKKTKYHSVFMTFDIESTTISTADRPEGFMYIWQVAIGETNPIAVHGRTWFEFFEFLQRIRAIFHPTADMRLVCYVHYLAYEFQFIRNLLNFTEVFATDKRQVLRAFADGIEFRCSYKLSNMSLDKFCKYTGAPHKKVVEHFDYTKVRTPETPLTMLELYYCFCDVVGLHEAIQKELESDSLGTIPMTSTGYVRRDCREAMKTNGKNWNWFSRCALNPKTYNLVKEAMRGGDTHCNRRYAGEILEDVDCYDFASSYPYVMMCEYFPNSPFVSVGKIGDGKFRKYLKTHCLLFRAYFRNLRLKDGVTNPYVSLSKCTGYSKKNITCFNGRVMQAEVIAMTLTELDFEIIEHDYTYDQIALSDAHIAARGYLPEELKDQIRVYFQAKTDLKGVDSYLYGKSKNKVNGIFGMACTNPIHSEIWLEENEWKEEYPDLVKALLDYKKNRNNFLPYQVGLYVTAHARRNLRDIIWLAGAGNVYNDTDSCKTWGVDIADAVEEYNRTYVIPKAEKFKAYAIHPKTGEKVYMGIAEKEESYDQFRSWGAKKYAYVQGGKLHLTLAGVSKAKGVKQLDSLHDFRLGKVFVPDCGRTTAWHNDTPAHYITVDDTTIFTASNVAVMNSSYKLGVTDEFIESLQVDIDTLNEL